MNPFDKKLYKALKFFSKNTIKYCDRIKEENLTEYRKHVSEDVENYLFQQKYVDADTENLHGITPNGLEQFRIIEGIKHNQKTRLLAIIAVIVSLITFAIGFYFRGGCS